MRRAVVAAVSLGMLFAFVAPAEALTLKSPSADGDITVDESFTACGEVHFPPGTVFVGELAALGHVQGPGTKAGTVRGVLPFTASTSWAGCINGAYPGATFGDGKFTLTAHAATDDVVVAKQCVVQAGAVTCV